MMRLSRWRAGVSPAMIGIALLCMVGMSCQLRPIVEKPQTAPTGREISVLAPPFIRHRITASPDVGVDWQADRAILEEARRALKRAQDRLDWLNGRNPAGL
jgi:hypothetical protein